MKKQLFSMSALIAAVIMASCNNGTNSTGSTTDSTNTTTSTSTMDSNTANNKMSTDTAMNNTGTANKMDTSSAGKMASSTANNVSASDKKFMMEAASGGMMEVQAGQLAATNASNDRVKAFGNMMVQDHTNANNELKALASTKNVTLPDSLMAKHSMHLNMLRKKTGKDFDKAYMSMMLQDHVEDVNKFQMESKSATDADVKAFATKTLPVLKTHLDSARAINHMKM